MDSVKSENVWALILGASSGFGAATALQLAEEGYNIIGIHLDRMATMKNVEAITEKIKGNGVHALYFNHNAADASKRKEILTQLSQLEGGKPRVKVLMHTLAFGTLRSFIGTEKEPGLTQAQLEMTCDVMAHSLVYWTQDLVQQGFLMDGARIFAMTSSGGKAVIPYYGAVSAAKATLESHVRQLAYELGPHNIAVNAIMAGVTDTPALRKIPGSAKMIEVAQRKNPRGRLTTPEDIAKIIALLCKDTGCWISGGVIHADGGEEAVSYVGQGAPIEW